MNIENRIKLYFEDIIEDDVLLNKVFNLHPDAYVFKHEDCPLVFVTDGNNLYTMDMDEKDIDPIEKYGYSRIEACYNDYSEFTNDIRKIEDKIFRVLKITTWVKSSTLKEDLEEFKKDNSWFARLIIERDSLKEKMDALEAYNDSDNVKHLSKHHQDLLDLQFTAMLQYFGALVMRINLVISENNIKI
jgi:hypothetical protein